MIVLDHTDFQLAAGTVIGRDHREVPKNRQDGLYLVQDERCTVAVVTDGCGSGAHSEIGAQLGARLVAESIRAEVRRHASRDINWLRVRQDLLASLHVLARSMGGNLREVVSEYFLFTVVGVCLNAEYATFFAIGDGIVIVNGEVLILQPDEGNKPVYVGYGLIADQVDVDEQETRFNLVSSIRLDDLRHFLLGTDGAADLLGTADRLLPGMQKPVGNIEQFWTNDRYFRNGELVSRQLKLIARDWPKRGSQPGLLPDDTTLIAGRRMPAIS